MRNIFHIKYNNNDNDDNNNDNEKKKRRKMEENAKKFACFRHTKSLTFK